MLPITNTKWNLELLEQSRRSAGVSGQRIALTTLAVWLVALAGGLFAASRYAIIDWGMFFLHVKKGYTEAGAATIVSVNSVVGAVSSAFSGIISDRFFKSSRKELALMAGLLNIAALSLFMLVPGRQVWLDVMAMVMFGSAEDGTAQLAGHTFANGWTLDYLAVFWIGMAALSVVCVLMAGNNRKGCDHVNRLRGADEAESSM